MTITTRGKGSMRLMPGKVLIVDDIATNRIVLNVKLSAAGYTVVQASSGQAGLDTARRERPDIVLLSSSLPDMPVTGLLAQFGRDEALHGIPTIALVKGHETTRKLALLEAGAAALDAQAICSRGHAPQAEMRRLIESAPSSPDIVLVECAEGEATAQSLSLISDLRAGPNTRHCGLVVVVPGNDSQLLASAFDRGADDVLVKGFHTRELRLKVQRLARRKRLGDARRAHMQAGLHAAITDPLTGLFNRRYALPHLEKLTAGSRPETARCAVMALDIDHFKRINDQHGHQVGDAVLAELAELLKNSLRKDDIAARIGGEEFLVVLPDTSRAEAQETAQRLCRLISRHAFQASGVEEPLRVTVSIGLAMTERGGGPELPPRAEDAVETLLAR